MASRSRVFQSCRVLFAAAKTPTSTVSRKTAAATPAPKPSPVAPAAEKKSKKTTVAKPTAKKPVKQPITFSQPPGILKVRPISPALRNFLGVPESARTDAVKKIWEYIKLHNLQNPENGREIVCDDELKKIFEGREIVGLLEVPKLLTPHFVKN